MYFSPYFSIFAFEGWTNVRFVKIKVPPIGLARNTFSLTPRRIIENPSCVVSFIIWFFEMIFKPYLNAFRLFLVQGIKTIEFMNKERWSYYNNSA